MENRNKSVSPEIFSNTNNENLLSEVFTNPENSGLTKREYFAALAMQGLIAGRWACPDNVPNDVNTIVKEAIIHADELLKQLEN